MSWIAGNGAGTHWRIWEDGLPQWTSIKDEATRFARRIDAEAVHAEDDDVWNFEELVDHSPYIVAKPSEGRKAAGGYREDILQLLLSKPGIMSGEIRKELKLARVTVGRHIRLIRDTWGAPGKKTTKGKKRPDRRAKTKPKIPNLFLPAGAKRLGKKTRKKTIATGVDTDVATVGMD